MTAIVDDAKPRSMTGASGQHPRKLRAPGAAAGVHHFQYHRSQDQLHGQFHLAAWRNNDIGPGHEGIVHHRQQVGKVDSLGVGKSNDDETLVGCRNVPRGKRIGCIDGGNALEIDVRLRKLRTDVIHVVRHAPQDGIDDGFGGVAARLLVAVELLNPFQIDDRNDTDGKVGVPRDVHVRRDDGAVQALVKQQVGIAGNLLPFGKGPRLLLEWFRFPFIVQVTADLAKTLSPAAEAFRYFILERGEAFLAVQFAANREKKGNGSADVK